jgi:hypothetical protein
MSKNVGKGLEALKKLGEASVQITEAEIEDFLNEEADVLSLQEQIEATLAEAYAHMDEAKKLNETVVADALSAKDEAVAERNHKAEVCKMVMDQVYSGFYALEPIQKGFKAREGNDPALRAFKAKCKGQVKVLQAKYCAKELQEREDAAEVAEHCIGGYRDAKAQADAAAERGRELFAKADELKKELASCF